LVYYIIVSIAHQQNSESCVRVSLSTLISSIMYVDVVDREERWINDYALSFRLLYYVRLRGLLPSCLLIYRCLCQGREARGSHSSKKRAGVMRCRQMSVRRCSRLLEVSAVARRIASGEYGVCMFMCLRAK